MSRNPGTEAGREFVASHSASDSFREHLLGFVLRIEDEAAVTERRLTVDRIRQEVVGRTWPVDPFDGESSANRILRILDDLATADVDEEMAEANREMEADLWNSDR